jgi:hypothetical protein
VPSFSSVVQIFKAFAFYLFLYPKSFEMHEESVLSKQIGRIKGEGHKKGELMLALKIHQRFTLNV